MTGWTMRSARQSRCRMSSRSSTKTRAHPAENPFDAVLATGRIVGLANHTSLIARDGTEVAIEDSAAPIRERQRASCRRGHGVPRRHAAAQAERALRASEERLRAVFCAGSGRHRDRGSRRYVSRKRTRSSARCSAIHSRSCESARSWSSLTPTTERRRNNRFDGCSTARFESYSVEKRYVRKDGSPVWSSTTVTLLRQEGGAPTQFLGIVEDITERRAWPKMRRRDSPRSSSPPTTRSSPRRSTESSRRWNPGAQRIFGYTAAEAIGKPVTMLIPDEAAERRADHPRAPAPRRSHRPLRDRSAPARTALVDVSLTRFADQGRDRDASSAPRRSRATSRVQKRAEESLRDQNRTCSSCSRRRGRSIASQLELRERPADRHRRRDAVVRREVRRVFLQRAPTSRVSPCCCTRCRARRGRPSRGSALPRNTPIFKPTFTGQGIVRSRDITRMPRYGTMAPHRRHAEGPSAGPQLSRGILWSRAPGEVLGGLFFGHPDADIFTEGSERLIVGGIAAQAAVAMDNARLYEAAQREIASRERAEEALARNRRAQG